MKLIEIHRVRGYIDENGIAQLNLEDISRGLGFTQTKNGTEYVRWETVESYLSSFGFSQQVGKEGFVPENIFYRLAMKAKNEVAESFQAKVADEILPTIRKTGTYSVQPQFSMPTNLLEAAELWITEMKKNEYLESKNQQLALESAAQQQQLKEQEAPLAIYNLAIAAKNLLSMSEVAKAYGTGRNRLYDILRDEQLIMKGSTLPYQRFIDSGYFKVVERPRTSGDTIVMDSATRVTAKGFDYIGRLFHKRAEREQRMAEHTIATTQLAAASGMNTVLQ